MKKFTRSVLVWSVLLTLVIGIVSLYEKDSAESEFLKNTFVKDVAAQDIYQKSYLEKIGSFTLGMMYLYPKQASYLAQAYDLYGEKAEAVFDQFGHLTLLPEVVSRYGAYKVIPLLWDSMTSENVFYSLDGYLDRIIDTFFLDQELMNVPEDERRVMKRLIKIHSIGESYLSRFILCEDGHIEALAFKTSISVVENFLLGGVENLESKIRSSTEITREDMLDAGIDVITLLPIAWLAKSGKVAIAAKGAAAGTKGLKVASKGVGKFFWKRAIKYGAIGTGLYLVATNPTAVNYFLSSLATMTGFHPLLVIFTFWFVFITALLSVTKLLWRPLVFLFFETVRVINWFSGYTLRRADL